ncbi:subtilisin-like protein [Phlegmacium glaucopus]|nr:subtilisin-like protein [Phlegmacium glaucopus]
MRSVLPFVVTLLGVAFAVPSPRSSHVVHETRAAQPIHWVNTGRLDSNRILPMRFGLVQQNLHRIEEMLMSVSHPESPKYAQHFTPMEVVDIFAPSEETISAVTNWLIDAGFSRDRLRLSPNKGWIHVDASTSEVEDLLKTEYHVYAHPSGDTQIGCHNYSLPSHIREHVDLIKPTVHFNHRPAPNALSKRAGRLGQPSTGSGPKKSSKSVRITPSLENCDQFITLDCLRALYNINYTPRSTHKNTFGIVEFTPQAFLGPDLDLFFRNFSPSLVGVRPQSVLIDGAVVQTTNQSFNFNGESSLDLEYGMGLTNPQPIILLQVGDLVEGAGFDNWLDAVDGTFCGGDDPTQDGIYPDPLPGGFKGPESCGIIKPPNVVSISYGQDEATATAAFANRQCQEYAKLGMMGTSVIYSSGDDGVAGFGGVCLDSNHQEDPVAGTVFNPEFPSSCPFVTAVGATQVNPGSTVNDPEGACEQVIFSGGGFSNIFPLLQFQKDSVQDYAKKHLNPSPFAAGQFNDSGNARGVPDIAANGANYVIGIDGNFELVFGTSASAPVFASMVTLINDARITIGKKSVGYLNPIIYSPSFASTFNDITMGGNQGCGTAGFNATKGWDPVTGLGTPNFEKLLQRFLLLP